MHTTGQSYPSAHAANAVGWLALAIALGPAIASRGLRVAAIVVGALLAVLVGLSRVYLRANWLSDVTGGWGLAAALFSLCGLTFLVVGYVRDNTRRAA